MAWYYKVSILSIYLCHRSEVIVWEHKPLQWIIYPKPTAKSILRRILIVSPACDFKSSAFARDSKLLVH
jgi:hypothetical protein